MPFSCSICGEESTRICVRCTKDACDNHLCEKCRKCSDCCECEVALTPQPTESVRDVLHPAAAQAEPVVEAAPAIEAEAPKEETAPAEIAPASMATPAPDGVAEVPTPLEAPEQAVETLATEPASDQSAPETPAESVPEHNDNLLP